MTAGYQGKIAAKEPLCVLPESAIPRPPPKRDRRTGEVYEPVTDDDRRIYLALRRCGMRHGFDSRFMAHMDVNFTQAEPVITGPQREQLRRMSHTYRRQLSADIVALAREGGGRGAETPRAAEVDSACP